MFFYVGLESALITLNFTIVRIVFFLKKILFLAHILKTNGIRLSVVINAFLHAKPYERIITKTDYTDILTGIICIIVI